MASSGLLSPKNWPFKENGRVVHYNPDTSKPPSIRGVLHLSTRGKPAAHWQQLMDTFEIAYVVPNEISYFVHKAFDAARAEEIKQQLSTALQLAFPDKDSVEIILSPGELRNRCGTWIEFHTPYSNIPASFQTSELFHPILFDSVPEECKDDFIAALPRFLTNSLDPVNEIEVLDIWEVQQTSSYPSDWRYQGDIVALVCIKAALPADGSLESIADTWPGWFHFDEEYLIRMEYPAQYLEGDKKRHKLSSCFKLTCGVCGHAGHDATTISGDKRECEEGKRKRLEERERKRQRTSTHDQETGQATQVGQGSSRQNGPQGGTTQSTNGNGDGQKIEPLQSDVQVKTEPTA
ncbi:related to conserved hypothetical Ustilaginaceae-specific protein [Ustilago trichophora]|uniref:Related to conserved hypothetical Ustilaginaceae-specific protein n=1 Tax=Ustilago trichophora TaxID=86804 RepID=A0A5C3EHP8_9BASI|nr:related to conserved hypothetical Ustilaginaceae-specific protein [Ustilago trichophora]